MSNRYIYAQALTLAKAQARLEDFYATGEVLESEQPSSATREHQEAFNMENCKTLSALERIAKEQASYYGKTPEQHARLMQDMSEAQDLIEREDKKTSY